jgi:hypothetical protein
MDLTALLLFQIQFGASRPEQTGSLPYSLELVKRVAHRAECFGRDQPGSADQRDVYVGCS